MKDHSETWVVQVVSARGWWMVYVWCIGRPHYVRYKLSCTMPASWLLEVSDTSLDAFWAGLVILCCVQCPSVTSYKTCWMLKPKIVKLEVISSKNSGQYKFNPQFLHTLFVKYGIFGLTIELDIFVQKEVCRQNCAVQFSLISYFYIMRQDSRVLEYEEQKTLITCCPLTWSECRNSEFDGHCS